MRFCALVVCLSVVGFAEAPMAVSDLVGMVTADLAVDRDDLRIAHTLEPVHLGERLSDSTVDMLRQMGAGRETVHQLQMLVRRSRALPLPSTEPIGLTPEPSASDKTAMLDAMRRYAAGYLAGLPDCVCTREVRQFATVLAGRPRTGYNVTNSLDAIPTPTAVDKPWIATGSYTAETAYTGGIDHYRLTLVDGKPTTKSIDQFHQKVSSGEFAGALKEVFVSGATFEWDRWEVTGGKRSAVFAYHADIEHSHYHVCCPSVVSAHRGFVYVDAQSGAVRRIIVYATGLTIHSPITAGGLVVEYEEVKIGDSRYLLPRGSAAYSRSRTAESRDDIEYRNYRKFGADATVAFPSAEQP